MVSLPSPATPPAGGRGRARGRGRGIKYSPEPISPGLKQNGRTGTGAIDKGWIGTLKATPFDKDLFSDDVILGDLSKADLDEINSRVKMKELNHLKTTMFCNNCTLHSSTTNKNNAIQYADINCNITAPMQEEASVRKKSVEPEIRKTPAELTGTCPYISPEKAALISNGVKNESSSLPPLDTVLAQAVDAPEFVPSDVSSDVSSLEQMNEQANEQILLYMQESLALNTLADVIQHLDADPGSFDDITAVVADHLSCFVVQSETLQKVSDMIIDKAIELDNFRFSAAKLTQLLVEAKLQVPDGTNFRKIFFDRCRSEFVLLKKLITEKPLESVNEKKVLVLTFVFGELLCNVKLKDNTLIPILKKVMFEIVDLFIGNPTDNLILGLVNLLKLVGPSLDEGRPKDTEDLFAKVRDFKFDDKRSGHINKDTLQSLFNVYKLHTRDWDRFLEPESTSPVYVPPAANVFSYQKQISRRSSDDSSVDWEDFHVYDDSELENDLEEMAELNELETHMNGYNQFLKETGQF